MKYQRREPQTVMWLKIVQYEVSKAICKRKSYLTMVVVWVGRKNSHLRCVNDD